jgi:hypothetical protein
VKWVALLFVLVAVPLVASRAKGDANLRGWIATLMAFSVFDPIHVNLISEEAYRGDSRGIEITSVDVLMVILWRALPADRDDLRPKWAALWLPRLLYMAAVLASFSATPDVLKSMYGLWKLARMYVFFCVLCGALREPAILTATLRGLGAGVLWQGGLALYQKYALHAVRVMAAQSHPNSLAMIVNFIAPIALAITLAGLGKRSTGLVVGVAAMCDVFSLCRGGMMMFVLASTFTVAASIARKPTPRKFKLVAIGVLGGAIAVAKAASTIIDRFLHAPKESEQARVLFNLAAKAMANDHTFGVGINMYSWTLGHDGYAARFAIDPGDRTGIAHHIYWLTAAETGYVGVTTYILLLAAVILTAARSMRLKDGRGDIAVGLVAGFAVTYIQGTAEWIARQTNQSYVFWILAAVAVALRTMPPIVPVFRSGAPR